MTLPLPTNPSSQENDDVRHVHFCPPSPREYLSTHYSFLAPLLLNCSSARKATPFLRGPSASKKGNTDLPLPPRSLWSTGAGSAFVGRGTLLTTTPLAIRIQIHGNKSSGTTSTLPLRDIVYKRIHHFLSGRCPLPRTAVVLVEAAPSRTGFVCHMCIDNTISLSDNGVVWFVDKVSFPCRLVPTVIYRMCGMTAVVGRVPELWSSFPDWTRYEWRRMPQPESCEGRVNVSLMWECPQSYE